MYRIVLINTETGKRSMVRETFTSRKKAEEFAAKWEKAARNSKVEIIKAK